MSTIGVDQNIGLIMNLDEEQKIIFMSVLARLAFKDGDFSDKEKSFIRELSELQGITKDNIKNMLETKDDDALIAETAKIKNRKVALELIKEMCVLAYSDGEISDKEITFIGKVGEAMEISLEKIEQISRWVIDRIIWQEEAKIIFEMD